MPAKRTHYQHLRDKWVERHKGLSNKVWTKHKESVEWLNKRSRELAVGSAASLLLLTSPGKPELFPQVTAFQTVHEIGKDNFLVSDLANLLPSEMRPLTPDEEQKVAEVLSRDFNLSVKAEIDGKRLPRTYGLIGQEQHLARYAGDSMSSHFDKAEDASLYGKHGMAPGLGAWRYFANSQAEMTEEDKLREMYYLAVPTFLAKDFNTRFGEYRDFFKYRKMLVVNPQNGKGIVAVVGDAGPAVWTGKHLGGSPEVMYYLNRVDRTKVLYYFIDDKENKVPLGPVELVK